MGVFDSAVGIGSSAASDDGADYSSDNFVDDAWLPAESSDYSDSPSSPSSVSDTVAKAIDDTCINLVSKVCEETLSKILEDSARLATQSLAVFVGEDAPAQDEDRANKKSSSDSTASTEPSDLLKNFANVVAESAVSTAEKLSDSFTKTADSASDMATDMVKAALKAFESVENNKDKASEAAKENSKEPVDISKMEVRTFKNLDSETKLYYATKEDLEKNQPTLRETATQAKKADGTLIERSVLSDMREHPPEVMSTKLTLTDKQGNTETEVVLRPDTPEAVSHRVSVNKKTNEVNYEIKEGNTSIAYRGVGDNLNTVAVDGRKLSGDEQTNSLKNGEILLSAMKKEMGSDLAKLPEVLELDKKGFKDDEKPTGRFVLDNKEYQVKDGILTDGSRNLGKIDASGHVRLDGPPMVTLNQKGEQKFLFEGRDANDEPVVVKSENLKHQLTAEIKNPNGEVTHRISAGYLFDEKGALIGAVDERGNLKASKPETKWTHLNSKLEGSIVEGEVDGKPRHFKLDSSAPSGDIFLKNAATGKPEKHTINMGVLVNSSGDQVGLVKAPRLNNRQEIIGGSITFDSDPKNERPIASLKGAVFNLDIPGSNPIVLRGAVRNDQPALNADGKPNPSAIVDLNKLSKAVDSEHDKVAKLADHKITRFDRISKANIDEIVKEQRSKEQIVAAIKNGDTSSLEKVHDLTQKKIEDAKLEKATPKEKALALAEKQATQKNTLEVVPTDVKKIDGGFAYKQQDEHGKVGSANVTIRAGELFTPDNKKMGDLVNKDGVVMISVRDQDPSKPAQLVKLSDLPGVQANLKFSDRVPPESVTWIGVPGGELRSIEQLKKQAEGERGLYRLTHEEKERKGTGRHGSVEVNNWKNFDDGQYSKTIAQLDAIKQNGVTSKEQFKLLDVTGISESFRPELAKQNAESSKKVIGAHPIETVEAAQKVTADIKFPDTGKVYHVDKGMIYEVKLVNGAREIDKKPCGEIGPGYLVTLRSGEQAKPEVFNLNEKRAVVDITFGDGKRQQLIGMGKPSLNFKGELQTNGLVPREDLERQAKDYIASTSKVIKEYDDKTNVINSLTENAGGFRNALVTQRDSIKTDANLLNRNLDNLFDFKPGIDSDSTNKFDNSVRFTQDLMKSMGVTTRTTELDAQGYEQARQQVAEGVVSGCITVASLGTSSAFTLGASLLKAAEISKTTVALASLTGSVWAGGEISAALLSSKAMDADSARAKGQCEGAANSVSKFFDGVGPLTAIRDTKAAIAAQRAGEPLSAAQQAIIQNKTVVYNLLDKGVSDKAVYAVAALSEVADNALQVKFGAMAQEAATGKPSTSNEAFSTAVQLITGKTSHGLIDAVPGSMTLVKSTLEQSAQGFKQSLTEGTVGQLSNQRDEQKRELAQRLGIKESEVSDKLIDLDYGAALRESLEEAKFAAATAATLSPFTHAVGALTERSLSGKNQKETSPSYGSDTNSNEKAVYVVLNDSNSSIPPVKDAVKETATETSVVKPEAVKAERNSLDYRSGELLTPPVDARVSAPIVNPDWIKIAFDHPVQSVRDDLVIVPREIQEANVPGLTVKPELNTDYVEQSLKSVFKDWNHFEAAMKENGFDKNGDYDVREQSQRFLDLFTEHRNIPQVVYVDKNGTEIFVPLHKIEFFSDVRAARTAADNDPTNVELSKKIESFDHVILPEDVVTAKTTSLDDDGSVVKTVFLKGTDSISLYEQFHDLPLNFGVYKNNRSAVDVNDTTSRQFLKSLLGHEQNHGFLQEHLNPEKKDSLSAAFELTQLKDWLDIPGFRERGRDNAAEMFAVGGSEYLEFTSNKHVVEGVKAAKDNTENSNFDVQLLTIAKRVSELHTRAVESPWAKTAESSLTPSINHSLLEQNTKVVIKELGPIVESKVVAMLSDSKVSPAELENWQSIAKDVCGRSILPRLKEAATRISLAELAERPALLQAIDKFTGSKGDDFWSKLVSDKLIGPYESGSLSLKNKEQQKQFTDLLVALPTDKSLALHKNVLDVLHAQDALNVLENLAYSPKPKEFDLARKLFSDDTGAKLVLKDKEHFGKFSELALELITESKSAEKAALAADIVAALKSNSESQKKFIDMIVASPRAEISVEARDKFYRDNQKQEQLALSRKVDSILESSNTRDKSESKPESKRDSKGNEIGKEFPEYSNKEFDRTRPEILADLKNWTTLEGSNIGNKFEALTDKLGFSAKEKNEILDGLNTVREHGARMREIDPDQKTNFEHTQREMGAVLDYAERNGFNKEQTQDLLFAAMFSDGLKTKFNFTTHNADGALAFEHFASTHLRDIPADRLAGIKQSILEHQLAPPEFMAMIYSGAIVASIRKEGREMTVEEADALKTLKDKISNPFALTADELVDVPGPPGAKGAKLTELEQSLLRRTGLDHWYVPNEGNAWNKTSRGLIDCDGIDNYFGPGGLAKIISLRADWGDKHVVFSNPDNKAEFSSVQSWKDSGLDFSGKKTEGKLGVATPETVEYTAKLNQSMEKIIDSSRARVNDWIASAKGREELGLPAQGAIGKIPGWSGTKEHPDLIDSKTAAPEDIARLKKIRAAFAEELLLHQRVGMEKTPPYEPLMRNAEESSKLLVFSETHSLRGDKHNLSSDKLRDNILPSVVRFEAIDNTSLSLRSIDPRSIVTAVQRSEIAVSHFPAHRNLLPEDLRKGYTPIERSQGALWKPLDVNEPAIFVVPNHNRFGLDTYAIDNLPRQISAKDISSIEKAIAERFEAQKLNRVDAEAALESTDSKFLTKTETLQRFSNEFVDLLDSWKSDSRLDAFRGGELPRLSDPLIQLVSAERVGELQAMANRVLNEAGLPSLVVETFDHSFGAAKMFGAYVIGQGKYLVNKESLFPEWNASQFKGGPSLENSVGHEVRHFVDDANNLSRLLALMPPDEASAMYKASGSPLSKSFSDNVLNSSLMDNTLERVRVEGVSNADLAEAVNFSINVRALADINKNYDAAETSRDLLSSFLNREVSTYGELANLTEADRAFWSKLERTFNTLEMERHTLSNALDAKQNSLSSDKVLSFVRTAEETIGRGVDAHGLYREPQIIKLLGLTAPGEAAQPLPRTPDGLRQFKKLEGSFRDSDTIASIDEVVLKRKAEVLMQFPEMREFELLRRSDPSIANDAEQNANFDYWMAKASVYLELRDLANQRLSEVNDQIAVLSRQYRGNPVEMNAHFEGWLAQEAVRSVSSTRGDRNERDLEIAKANAAEISDNLRLPKSSSDFGKLPQFIESDPFQASEKWDRTYRDINERYKEKVEITRLDNTFVDKLFLRPEYSEMSRNALKEILVESGFYPTHDLAERQQQYAKFHDQATYTYPMENMTYTSEAGVKIYVPVELEGWLQGIREAREALRLDPTNEQLIAEVQRDSQAMLPEDVALVVKHGILSDKDHERLKHVYLYSGFDAYDAFNSFHQGEPVSVLGSADKNTGELHLGDQSTLHTLESVFNHELGHYSTEPITLDGYSSLEAARRLQGHGETLTLIDPYEHKIGEEYPVIGREGIETMLPSEFMHVVDRLAVNPELSNTDVILVVLAEQLRRDINVKTWSPHSDTGKLSLAPDIDQVRANVNLAYIEKVLGPQVEAKLAYWIMQPEYETDGRPEAMVIAKSMGRSSLLERLNDEVNHLAADDPYRPRVIEAISELSPILAKEPAPAAAELSRNPSEPKLDLEQLLTASDSERQSRLLEAIINPNYSDEYNRDALSLAKVVGEPSLVTELQKHIDAMPLEEFANNPRLLASVAELSRHEFVVDPMQAEFDASLGRTAELMKQQINILEQGYGDIDLSHTKEMIKGLEKQAGLSVEGLVARLEKIQTSQDEAVRADELFAAGVREKIAEFRKQVEERLEISDRIKKTLKVPDDPWGQLVKNAENDYLLPGLRGEDPDPWKELVIRAEAAKGLSVDQMLQAKKDASEQLKNLQSVDSWEALVRKAEEFKYGFPDLDSNVVESEGLLQAVIDRWGKNLASQRLASNSQLAATEELGK